MRDSSCASASVAADKALSPRAAVWRAGRRSARDLRSVNEDYAVGSVTVGEGESNSHNDVGVNDKTDG